MKSIYIMKGWFNMEEMKNGVISEEALDEVAGGLSIDKAKLKNIVLKAGIPVVGAAALAATSVGAALAALFATKKGKKGQNVTKATHAPTQDEIDHFTELPVKKRIQLWEGRKNK